MKSAIDEASMLLLISIGIFFFGFWMGRLRELVRWQEGTGLTIPQAVNDSELVGEQSRMSARDCFSALAPTPPEWFSPVMPPCPTRPNPNDLPPEYRKQARDWAHDGCYDLQGEVLEDFQRRFTKAGNEIAEWEHKRAIETFFQWRWYYADAMLATRFSRSPLLTGSKGAA